MVSIPVASAQCRTWLRDHLPEVELRRGQLHRRGGRDRAPQPATRRSPPSPTSAPAEVYGLDDRPRPTSRTTPRTRPASCVVVAAGIPAPTGHDKSSIVVFQRADRPGSLLAILQEFAARSINLTLLLSRPTKTSLGDYCFLLDLDGHIADEVVADCLRTLQATQADVKFLGSYPAAGAHGPERRAEVEAAFHQADTWLATLRSQLS